MRHRNYLVAFLAAFILAACLLPAMAQAQDAEHATGNAAGSAPKYSYARIVRLSLVNGDVQYVRPGESKWQPAIANMPMQQGFTIGTNQGRAEVELENGSRIWLAENSMLQFTELALADGGHVNTLSLAYGTATFNADLKVADSFQVITTRVQASVPGKTSAFRVDAARDSTSVRVFKGAVMARDASDKQSVAKGQTFIASGDAAGQIAASDHATSDGWDVWVNNRDNLVTNGTQQTLQNMNAGFGYGLSDLASYGAWNYYPGYGYGWQPYGIGAGWQPFSSGDWGFYPGVGWTWLSEEPWGWAPYHFGQWNYNPGFGWFWRPTNSAYFNPAPVQWMQAGNKIGWIPLGASPKSTPVVVSEQGLGKWGPTRILTAEKAGGKMQELSAPPLANGKAGPSNMAEAKANSKAGGEAHVVVPASADGRAIKSSTAMQNAALTRPPLPRSAPPVDFYRQPMPNESGYRASASTLASTSAANRSGFPTAASRSVGAGAPSMTSARGGAFAGSEGRGSVGTSHASSSSSSSSSSGGGHPK
jgi:hypothetical protein